MTLLLSLSFASSPMLDFALRQWCEDRAVQIEDAYKWLYQATRGGEHAAPNEHEARVWLEEEWKNLDTVRGVEPLWQPLRPDGKIGRLNLRPFRAAGGRMADVLCAFLASAREFKSEPRAFAAEWENLGAQLRERQVGSLTFDEWQRLDLKMRAAGYPAIHHSQTYERAHHPAYRVLTGDAAQKLLAGLKART